MTSSGVFEPRLTRSSRSVRQAASLSPPMFLTARRTFWPSCLMPRAMRSEIDVDFLSSLTGTTVPSRINRMIGSSARERAFQASQSPLTLRQTPADRIFARGAAEEGRQRPADPARVGSGEIGRGDQRVGSAGAPLIGSHHL